MRDKTVKTVKPIPAWAICYLVNLDDSGINNDDKKLVDDWKRKNAVVEVIPDSEGVHPYFCNRPAFGDACDVEDCIVVSNPRKKRKPESGMPYKVRVGVEFACYMFVDAENQDEAEAKAREYVDKLKVKDGGDAIYDWLGEATHIHDTYEVEEK